MVEPLCWNTTSVLTSVLHWIVFFRECLQQWRHRRHRWKRSQSTRGHWWSWRERARTACTPRSVSGWPFSAASHCNVSIKAQTLSKPSNKRHVLTMTVNGEMYMPTAKTAHRVPTMSLRFLWSWTSSSTSTVIITNATKTGTKILSTFICGQTASPSREDHVPKWSILHWEA